MAREKIVVDIEADVKSLLRNLEVAKRKITDWKKSLNDANIKFDVNKPLKNLQNSLEKESVNATKGLNKQLSAVAKDIKIGVDTKQAKKDIAELEAALNRLKALSLAIKNAPFHVTTQKTAGNLAYGNNRASDARLLLSKLKDNGLDVDSAKKAVKNYENAVAQALKDSPSIANYQIKSGIISNALKDSFTMQKEAGLTPNIDKLKQKLAQVKVLEASMYDGLADNKNAQKSLTQAIGLLQELGDKAKAVRIDGFGNGLDSANAKMQQLKAKGQNVIDKINEPEISKAEQIRTSNNIARANNALDKEERRNRAEANKQIDAMWRQAKQEEIEQIRKDKDAEKERASTERALTALENKERREMLARQKEAEKARLAQEKNAQFNTRIKNDTRGAEKAWREGNFSKYNALSADRDATIAAQNEFLNSLRSISEQQKVYRNLLSQIKNGTITEKDPRYDTAAQLKNTIESRKNNFNNYAKQLLGDTGNSSAGVDRLTNSMKNNRREVNNDSKQFNELRKQLASTIAEINKFDTSADNGNKALNARVQEALGIMNNMKQFLTERGKLSYAAESKLYGDFLPSIKNEYARREWLKRQRAAAVNNNYANLGSGLRSNVEGRYEPTISSLKNILTTRLSGVELAKLGGSFERGFGSGMHELARQSEMVEKSILGINSGLAVLPEIISTGVAAFAGFSVAIGLAVSTTETLFSVVQSIGSAIEDYIIKPGLEAANAMQMMRNGIAGAMSSIGLLNNQPLQFGEALNMADGIVKQLAVDAIKTGTSLEAITNTFRAIIEPGLQAGMNISQIEEMANLFTTIGKELQLNSLTIARDTRDIFNGMANRTVMAKQLGITDQEIQEVKAKGEDLYAWLENRLAGFVASNRENIATLGGAFDSLKSTWELTLASVFDSDAVKQPVIEFMKWIGSQIATVYDMGINPNSAKWDALKKSSAARNGIDTSDQAAVDQNAEDTGLQDDATKYRDATGATEEETQALEEQNATVITLSESFEGLLNFVANFVEIIGDAIIEVAEYAEQSLGAEDSVDSLSDAISICTGLLVFIAERIIDVIALIEKNKTSIEDLGYDALYAGAILKNVFLGVISYIKPVIAVFRSLYNVATAAWDAMHGDADGAAKAITQAGVDAAEAAKGMLKKYIPIAGVAVTGADIITNSYRDIQTINGWRERSQQAREAGENSQPHKNLHDFVEGIRNFLNNMEHILSTQNPNQNRVKGRPADDSKEKAKAQREADKANRAAIRESQRMLKERQQALKEILDDTLNNLKEELRKADVAYKQGFLTIEEYFTKKAEIERAEAEARLKEAQEERIAIENSRFNSDYEKLSALHKVDREIRKYSLEVGKSVTAQKELNNILGQYSDIISNSNLAGTFNRINDGNSNIGLSKDGNGNISLSKDDNDFKYKADQSVKVLESLAPNGLEWVVDEIVNQAIANGVEPALAVAIAKNESGFDQNAISPVGAIGIGQLMPDTAAGLGVDPYDWKQNILGMITYIKELWETFGGDIAKVIAAYNAGPAAVKTYGGIPPYPETQAYYENVASTRDSAISSGYDLFDADLGRLNDINQKLWQSQQENTQAVQSNTQSINGIQIDTRELGNIVASAPDNPDIEDASEATKLFMQAVGNAWKKLHPELSPLEVSSAFRAGNTNSHHGYGEAFDVVNDYFDNPKLREEYVNLINSLGGKGLSEWTSDEAPGVYRSGSNIHATTPNANYGNGGIFSASTPSSNTLNNLPQAQADTSDLAVAARDAINKFIEEYNKVVEDIRSNIFGEMPDFKVAFADTFNKIEKLEHVAGRDDKSAKMVEKLKIQIRQKIAKLETDFYENMLEVNLERIQQTGKDIANRIATGQTDPKQIEEYYKKYWGYFHGDGQDVEVMKKNLEEMKQKKKKALNTWLTSKDGGKGYSNGELIAKYEKEYLDLNNKQYELEHTKGSAQEEINKVIAQKLERRKKLHEMYAMQDFIFKPMEDNISEYQQEIMLSMQTPINQMIQLEKKYIEQQDLGNVKAAQEIRKRLEGARETLYGVFDTWIKAIEDKFNTMDNYFAEMPVTNLQREQGEKELKAFRNRELVKANQDKLNALTEEYRERTLRITKNEQEIAHWKEVQAQAERDGVRGNDTYVEAGNHIKELAHDTQAAKLEMSELNRQIGDTDNLIRLEKELSKLPDLFTDAGNVAKQALEDGLVTFLTDGVNEADSLKDALLDLAKTFLKTMQEFFAKQLVTTMMNKLFGQYDTEGSGERNDLFKRATVSQEIPTDDENVKKIVYMSGADHEIVGGDIHYIDENAKATVKALKDEGIIAKLDENGKGYSVPVSSDEASKWYTGYVKNTTVEKGNQTSEGINSEVSQNDNQELVSAIQDNGNKITSTLTDTNAKLDVIHNDLTQANTLDKKSDNLQKNLSNSIDSNINNVAKEAQVQTTVQEAMQSAQSVQTGVQYGIQSNTLQNTVATQTNGIKHDITNQKLDTVTNNQQMEIAFQAGHNSESDMGGGSAGFIGGGGLPFLGLGQQTGGLGSMLGGMVDSIAAPIAGIASSVLNDVASILNNKTFTKLFSSTMSVFGSAGAQLAGTGFAVKSFIKGDTKEKLLSMLYIEEQLIYVVVSQISGYCVSILSAIESLNTTNVKAATGGYISGEGTSTSDSIPAMLSNGEFVVKASSVRKYGTGFLNAVNNGNFTKIHSRVYKFADGGSVVSSVPQETARGMQGLAKNVGASINNTTTMNVALVNNQQEAMKQFMQSPQGQRIMLDFSRGVASFTSNATNGF